MYIFKKQIVHIDGAYFRVPTKPEFNYGNVAFELQLFSTTVINDIGMHEMPEEEAVQNDPDVDMGDVIHFENQIISKSYN